MFFHYFNKFIKYSIFNVIQLNSYTCSIVYLYIFYAVTYDSMEHTNPLTSKYEYQPLLTFISLDSYSMMRTKLY